MGELERYWWEAQPSERYWCEITDRRDLGADLKCPQTDEQGHPYWSYSLIQRIAAGDVVYHYSTRERAFVGASVAGTPLEERRIVWSPHGTVGRSRGAPREPRPGWWLPLYGFKPADPSLTLRDLQAESEQAWLRSWISERQKAGPVAAPLQLYPGNVRAAQGYLTKMPAAFVDRYSPLSTLEGALSLVHERLVSLGSPFVRPLSPAASGSRRGGFREKSAEDYVAIIKASVQRRSRNHERIVSSLATFLEAGRLVVSNPHPKDLICHDPAVIFEVKTTAGCHPLFAVRDAVGQLLEYRHFLGGPADAQVCIVLDTEPDKPLIDYVEDHLRLLLLWSRQDGFTGGPRTRATFPSIVWP